MIGFVRILVVLGVAVGLFSAGCVTTTGQSSLSQSVNAKADQAMYKPIHYVNASKAGPPIVVLPGEIKSANATFSQKVTPNNIADFAELELTKANFQVLERSDLGPLLKEIKLAVGLGDPEALQKFKRGKFKSTKWFVEFDILRAEPVASGSSGFNARALGTLIGVMANDTPGAVTGAVVGDSVKTNEACQVWIVGLRYKILNANTTEQVATGYLEDKMEIGSKSSSFLGISQSQAKVVTLDTMVQRLTQNAVAEIDRDYK